MGYLGTKPANSPLTSELIPDGIITPADLSQGKPVWDTSGNVGIGTSSPSTRLQVAGNTKVGTGVASNSRVLMVNTPSGTAAALQLFQDANESWVIENPASSTALTFANSNTERMRIDSSGNLLVGATASVSTGRVEITKSGQHCLTLNNTSSLNQGQEILNFIRNGTQVGNVNSNLTTTVYATSSDYRLKENIAPMIGALDKVAQLKPCTYVWKSTGEADEGFIAHELQEVCPSAVSGEKDAVDAEGNPQYQGIDTSFLVATLTAAIQEQQAIITELKTRIEALEQV